MNVDSDGLPPELPPQLPPQLPPAARPTSAAHRGNGCLPMVAVVSAVAGVAISAAIGVAFVDGTIAIVGYLTEVGLTASVMGLSVALWPVAFVLAGIASDDRVKESKALLNAVALGLIALPPMVALRMFVIIHFGSSPRLYPAPWSGVNSLAVVIAAIFWGLLGGSLTFAVAFKFASVAADANNK